MCFGRADWVKLFFLNPKFFVRSRGRLRSTIVFNHADSYYPGSKHCSRNVVQTSANRRLLFGKYLLQVVERPGIIAHSQPAHRLFAHHRVLIGFSHIDEQRNAFPGRHL